MFFISKEEFDQHVKMHVEDAVHLLGEKIQTRIDGIATDMIRRLEKIDKDYRADVDALHKANNKWQTELMSRSDEFHKNEKARQDWNDAKYEKNVAASERHAGQVERHLACLDQILRFLAGKQARADKKPVKVVAKARVKTRLKTKKRGSR